MGCLGEGGMNLTVTPVRFFGRMAPIGVAALLIAAIVLPVAAQNGAPPTTTTPANVSGEALYKTRCAACHDSSNERIPPRSALQAMPSARILSTLDVGVMVSIGFTMSRAERMAVASYLGRSDALTGPRPAAFCADRAVTLSPQPNTSWV